MQQETSVATNGNYKSHVMEAAYPLCLWSMERLGDLASGLKGKLTNPVNRLFAMNLRNATRLQDVLQGRILYWKDLRTNNDVHGTVCTGDSASSTLNMHVREEAQAC